MRRGSKRSSYASRERAPEYMRWVRTLSCVVGIAFDRLWRAAGIATGIPTAKACDLRCDGPIEANHAGVRIAGLGTKALDRTCVAMCREHHRQWTEYAGIFSGLTHVQRRAIAEDMVLITHTLAERRGVEVPTC
jgi:hypothetical protein